MTQFLTNEQILNKAEMLSVAGRTKTILGNTVNLLQSPAEVKLNCKKRQPKKLQTSFKMYTRHVFLD